MNRSHLVIAVDGPAAAGKGTLARRLAEHFGLAYLDTGLMYRAAGLAVLEAGGDPGDPQAAVAAAKAFRFEDLSRADLRDEATAAAASEVAAIAAVREVLVARQRAFALKPPPGTAGVVLDGRDIGSVVCPSADLKLFVTASADVRARRRVKELQARKLNVIEGDVLRDMQVRDARDRNRSAAPLHPAEGAVVIDTSDLDADQVFHAAIEIARTRCPGVVALEERGS